MPAPIPIYLKLQQNLARELAESGIENAIQEARWIVEIACQGRPFDNDAQARIDAIMAQRLNGMPFQYAVGTVEFYNVELHVGPGVLIPRPETELLVEEALRLVQSQPAGSLILDLCTGSGAIPLAMSRECPQFHYTAIDISSEALKWAKQNQEILQPEHFRLLKGDLFQPLAEESPRFYSLITANPPYVSPAEYAVLPHDVKDFEPRLALEAAEDGLAVSRAILEQGRQYMLPHAALLMEIGETQGEAILDIARKNGYRQAEIIRDLAGKDRILKTFAP